ncbi:aldehyde dehydrogenase (NADP(+)) [Robiginitalea sp.]|uniref:aldehyde dehydrogenase (NADP(+)) n=1 Tax=Robiginitalea sp. TaxID=1902411 RepID=UPI003C76699F
MQYTITGHQLLGFSESALGKNRYQTFNPQTGTATPWKFCEATDSEVHTAMELARTAFERYRELPGNHRAEFLRAIAVQLEQQQEDLVSVYMQESGLPEGRARGELGRTTGQLRAFAAVAESSTWMEVRIDTAQPDRAPAPKPDIRKCMRPLGPVVVFGASNFPFAFSTAGGDTASALAVGCPVVVKGHPMHAGTSEAVGRCIQMAARQTAMPEGVFSLLQGSSTGLGESLVRHPATKAVGFTGSKAGGLALSRLGAERVEPIPVFAEMGSINPVVVLPSATEPGKGWAKAYALSVTLGAGQFCTNPGLVLGIEGSGWTAFSKALAAEVDAVGTACMLHPKIASQYQELQADFFAQAGVNRMTSKDEDQADTRATGGVALVSAAAFRKNARLKREVFGPFTLLVTCEDQQDLMRTLTVLEGQLTASLLGDETEIQSAAGLVALLGEKAGRLLINGVPTGVEVCPSMHHGGPFPATTDSRFTSVGTDAVKRWIRPLSFQNFPEGILPPALKDDNPLGILRMVNGKMTTDPI